MSDQQYRTLIDAEALARRQGKSELAAALREWLDAVDEKRKECEAVMPPY